MLLDLALPASAGMDTIGRARVLVPGTPILALSPADDEPLRRNVLRRGMESYFVKGDASAITVIKAIQSAAKRTRPPGARG